MAFGYCNKLKEIYISKTVTSISASAFDRCFNLKVNCAYTKEECPFVSAIEKDDITVIWGYVFE